MCPGCGATAAPAPAASTAPTTNHATASTATPAAADAKRMRRRKNARKSRSARTSSSHNRHSGSGGSGWRTHTWETIPAYLRDNHFVRSGYRVDLGWSASLRSIFALHNETMNVWTHLIGFTVVAALLVSTVVSLSPYGLDRLHLTTAQHPLERQQPLSTSAHPLSDSIPDLSTPATPTAATASDDLHSSSNSDGDASDADRRSILERLLSSPDAIRDALHRLNAQILPAVERTTASLRAKASRLADDAASHFTRFLNGIEAQVDRLQAAVAASSSDHGGALPALKELIVANAHEFAYFLAEQKIDAVAYSQYLIDQFRVRGGTALKLLLPNTHLSTSECYARARRRQQREQTASGVVNATTTIATAGGDGSDLMVSGIAATTDSDAPLRVRVDSSNGGDYQSTEAAEAAVAAAVAAEHMELESDVICTQLVSHLPVWPISVFMLSALCCLGFSTVYHLFSSHSEYIASQFQRLDYCGIALLIAGSNIPVLFYGFACAPVWRAVYITIISAAGLVCFVLTTSARFMTPPYRPLRCLAFVVMGVGGAIPALHMFALGMDRIFFDLILMGATYLFGALVYVSRVPERFKPDGTFDIWLSSHQLWHCFVAAAILIHYAAVIRFFEWRMHHACPAIL